MPTTYTARILDGKTTTFRQFAEICMRNFDGTQHLHNESLDAEYKPKVVSDFYTKEVEAAKQVLIDAQEMPDEAIIETRKKNLVNDEKYHSDAIEKVKKSTIVLNKILADVLKWQPPTPEHIGIKMFMIDQIKKTIVGDCDTDYHRNRLVEIRKQLLTLDASEIRKQIIEYAKKQIAYYTTQHLEEIECCENVNKWVSDLLKSLPA